MLMLNHNSWSYKLVTFGVVLGFVQFVVGFWLPMWKRDDTSMIGLWQRCNTTLEHCIFYSSATSNPNIATAAEWLDGVRIAEAVSFVTYCVTLFILGDVNCGSRSDSVMYDRCVLPITCVCTGLLGVAGVTVYSVYESDGHSTFSVGLYLTCVGSSFIFICGLLFLCLRSYKFEDSFEVETLSDHLVYRTHVNPVFRADFLPETEVFY